MGKDARGRGVAGEGEDDQEIPGRPATRCWPRRATSRTCPRRWASTSRTASRRPTRSSPARRRSLAELKGAAAKADDILLATDPDREGEAIAWHLAEELTGTPKKAKRVEFHEITKNGVQKGVDLSARAQQEPLRRAAGAARARPHRRLRRVGARLDASSRSACPPGACSASRSGSSSIASARSRRSCPRSTGTSARARASRRRTASKRPRFFARLTHERTRSSRSRTASSPGAIKADLATRGVSRSRRSRRASASARRRRPYTTSKLQQDAVNRLGFGAKRTMQIAQGLYEGVDLGKDAGGRSVSSRTCVPTPCARAGGARGGARRTSTKKYGKDYLPKAAERLQDRRRTRRTRTRRSARRSLDFPPDVGAQAPQGRAVQALQADLGSLRREPDEGGALRSDRRRHRGARRRAATMYGLRAGGRVLKFAGWLEAYGVGVDRQSSPARKKAGRRRTRRTARRRRRRPTSEATLPELTEGEALKLVDAAGRRSRSKSSRSRRRATTKARSCASSRSAASAARARTPRSSARCRRATTSRRSTAAHSSRRTLGKFVVDGLVNERARLHGSRRSRRAWKRSSTRSRRARRSASICSRASTRSSASSSTVGRRASAGTPSPSHRRVLRRLRTERHRRRSCRPSRAAR